MQAMAMMAAVPPGTGRTRRHGGRRSRLGRDRPSRAPGATSAYTLVVMVLALGPGPNYLGSKPRFLLPAMLLALPLARLLARASGWILVPLIAVFAAASTWFGLYLLTVGWAP